MSQIRAEGFSRFWIKFSDCLHLQLVQTAFDGSPAAIMLSCEVQNVFDSRRFCLTPTLDYIHLTMSHPQKLNPPFPLLGARDPPSSIPAEPVGSSALMPALLSTASGVILDIGPGTGTQMPLLTNPGIKAIYGAEPTDGLHTDLLAKIDSCGLSSKYQILPLRRRAAIPHPSLGQGGLQGAGQRRL
uniref:Uncharacterized protein n=1 Tax=Coccidioides posadasii RMSCC 3488 TaxID=454284 RepID=A0A0J6FAB0_COCPO|nr:LOW QUALITY PROTEIN: hypothetical protein CPAG_03488 [Coccidioides posadasii RMSCC 3488]